MSSAINARSKAASPIDEAIFQKAGPETRRLKLLAWGDSGAGKTTLAAQFPNPALIDLEGGADHYGDTFSFDVFKAATAEEVNAAVDWLLTHDHLYRTLVVDPITVYWDALQRKWSDIFLRRNKGTKGHRLEYYDLQPRDWMTIKAEHREFLGKLIQLDMNVIVTARQKTLYGDQGFMRAVGETFDGEKSLPYLFDTILRLYRDDKGRFMAENLKDRTNKLPQGHFEISYEILQDRLGEDFLGRKAVPLQMAAPDQVESLRHHIAASGMEEGTVSQRLAAYGADTLEGLTQDNAQKIIEKFEAVGSKSAQIQTASKEAPNAED
ncbi:MAG: ATP-binding protein [Spirochaetales bacterium]|nr:ATP-binding protein [Spirochaetales bacterium]